MKRKYRQVRVKLAAGTLILLGGLGVAGCKTSQKVEPTPRERAREALRLDSIPDRYPEAVAMYGTPYREFQEQKQVPTPPKKKKDK